MLLTTDKLLHYKAYEDHIGLKDGLSLQNYHGDTGFIKYYQTSLCGEVGKHPRITKTIIACRQKYYYPNMAQLIRQWVMSCEQCIRESRVDDRLIQSALQKSSAHITAPEYVMQIDLLTKIPPSGRYEKIVTVMDVFSRYLFAYPISS